MLTAFRSIEPDRCRECNARINEIYCDRPDGPSWLGCHHLAHGYTIVLEDGAEVTYIDGYYDRPDRPLPEPLRSMAYEQRLQLTSEEWARHWSQETDRG